MLYCCFPNTGASQVKSETGSYTRRGGETEEKGRPPRLAGGRFEVQGDLLRRLLLGGHKTSGPLTPPTRIFPGFSHVYHPNGLNGYCSLKAVPLKVVWLWDCWVERTVPRTGEGVVANQQAHPLMTSSDNNWNTHLPPTLTCR